MKYIKDKYRYFQVTKLRIAVAPPTVACRVTSVKLPDVTTGYDPQFLAMKHPEQVGLITLNRTHGKNPTVTILPVSKGE